MPSFHHNQRHILSVTELTSQIKSLLEDSFAFVWITGEISNFRVPVSGPFYFSLKDSGSQINAVMFRGQNAQLKFDPEDGMQINGIGRVSLYEPRGSYQIILEYMEPSGMGALQVAFEQLKQKLADEGLFDEKYKKAIPFLPNKISVITSPTGSVVHDIIRVLNRRFSTISVEIIPAKVQGLEAEQELVNAIDLLNQRNQADVAILARGGGSLEDLHPFNTEGLTRKIFASKIPIVSAVGHETDFTLADFVADLRAPTPSAAAEMVVPVKQDLIRQHANLQAALVNAFSHYLRFHRTYLKEFSKRLVDPRKRVQDLRLKTDDLTDRLVRAGHLALKQHRERLHWRWEKLKTQSPAMRLIFVKNKLEFLNDSMLFTFENYVDKLKNSVRESESKLTALSPLSILNRGYSITRLIDNNNQVVRSSENVQPGDRLQILLGSGSLEAKTTKVHQESGISLTPDS